MSRGRATVPHAARGLAAGLALAGALALPAAPGRAAAPAESIAAALRGVDPALVRSGALLDRAPTPVPVERFDGGAAAPVAAAATWREIADALRRASTDPRTGPDVAALMDEVRAAARRAPDVPLAVLDRGWERLRPDAVARGAATVRDGRVVSARGDALESGRAFAFAALLDHTYRGGAVSFVLERRRWFGDAGSTPVALAVDFDDGQGPRAVRFDRPIRARYPTPGTRTLRLIARFADGTRREARARFEVRAIQTPVPDDTLHITATVPYRGAVATGDAYVRLAPGHAGLVNPIVVVEGFDLDNSMNWDELYAQLDEQGLADTLWARGFDEVVLNFGDATTWMQRNAFVVTELLSRVQQAIAPTTTVALVGPSMGALVGQYALAWLEAKGIGHRVRTFLSFDGPHQGADIPLGIQYWVKFFSSMSSEAAYLLGRLNTPAARQMLIYHLADPFGPTAQPDSVRAGWLADLAAVGGYPRLPRKVAVANGSGARVNQGFNPGDQLIRWEYSSLFVSITGDVWAVPNVVGATIFKGSTRILISTTGETVGTSGTQPWDGAPGGWRATMAEMDAVPAPYGDIVALHPNHCFVPTVSALDVATADPFYDVAGDPALLAHTPFDAVYFPSDGANQEHVSISPEAAVWLRNEIGRGVLAVPPGPPAAALGLRARPNPAAGEVALEFTLPRPGPATVRVFDVGGREVATLARGAIAAGVHHASWDGRDAAGRRREAGLYFVHLEAAGRVATLRLVRIR